MLRFSKFEKSYQNISVLQIDDLSLDPGVYWIKGANGSGKSTLLKSIAGILTFKGNIFLEEKISIKEQSFSYRKLVNFAEAEPLFPEFLTGKEMISLFSKAKNASKKQEEYLIESMNIQNYIHQPISTFSTGMLKKLSLILAFLGNPKLILLDEPLITIDKDAIETVYCWIKEKSRNGVNFMLTTHQDLDIGKLSFAKELIVISQTLRLNN